MASNTRGSSHSVHPDLKRLSTKAARSDARRFAKALKQIGDPQALLVMRELSLGVRRFQGIQAQTKLGSHILSSRLRRLQKDGIVERRAYCDHPLRYEYFATAKGMGLDAVLFAAGNWNVRWGNSTEPPSWIVFDKVTGKRLTAVPLSRPRAPKV